MSYVIGIERIGGPPLSEEELVRALNQDGDFEQVSNASWLWTGSPEGIELHINLAKDHLWTDGSRSWTSPDALRALNRVAASVNARVMGEENEDLTGIDAPRQPEIGGDPTKLEYLVGIVFILPLMVLKGILLLPVAIWRCARRK